MTLRILIADDEKAARYGMAKALATVEGGVEIAEATTGAEALAAIQARPPHLVLLDLNMPEMDGMAVLEALAGPPPGCEIVVVTADDALETAIACMKLGATDYVTKPFELEELRAIARRNGARVRLEERVVDLQAKLDDKTACGALVGISRPMRELFERMERAATAPLDLLIRGETGTGKELIARQIHALSPRRAGPFVAVNTAAISESLAESELFGHVAGAFTGAKSAHRGFFEQAHGGTLFLDEIGDMPAPLQTKLLRVLEERALVPVGGQQSVAIDIRVISATHADLEELLADGRFRSDLFYRIRGIELWVEPLRHRHEDIVLLAQHFLARFANQSDRPRPQLTNDAVDRLLSHAWPGNVRELENCLKAAASMCAGETIGPSDLALAGESVEEQPSDPDLPLAELFGMPLREGKDRLVSWFETRTIERALRENDGNVSAAARQLGMHRQSLQKKMAQLGLSKKPSAG